MALLHRLEMPIAKEAPQEPTMPLDPRSVGEELRHRRDALGLDLTDVAAALRIKPAYLAALEMGRLAQLPGSVYAIGFLRAYAEHLGLDGGALLRRFKQESLSLVAKPNLVFPIPLGERSVPGGGTLLVALILAVCAYGGWFYLSTEEGARPERVAKVPATLWPAPEQSLARTTVSRPAEALAASQPSAALTDASASSRPIATKPDLAGPSPATPAVSTEIEPIARAETSPAMRAPKDVVIRATADSWIQIRDARQLVLLARVLKAGESYRAPDQPGLSMRTGNAGGLEIKVGGIPAPSIGRMGMVRRNVALDGQALLAGSAVRN